MADPNMHNVTNNVYEDNGAIIPIKGNVINYVIPSSHV